MRNLIRILILLTVIICSCSQKDSEFKKYPIIQQKEMVSVLTDLYLADGLLAFPPVRNLFTAKDSVSNYIDIINKHGFTKEQMDMSLKYYFIENPKKLQTIYDEVLAKLSEMQSSLIVESPVQTGKNLWNQKDKWSVPEDGAHNLLFFSIPVKDTGLYEITFTAIIYKDDQSLRPRATTYFWHSSDKADGVRDPWNDVELIRDGTRHNYSITKKLTDPAYTHISGWLFQCDDQKGSWIKHGTFSAISVVRIPFKTE
jgi:hypothetical protein